MQESQGSVRLNKKKAISGKGASKDPKKVPFGIDKLADWFWKTIIQIGIFAAFYILLIVAIINPFKKFLNILGYLLLSDIIAFLFAFWINKKIFKRADWSTARFSEVLLAQIHPKLILYHIVYLVLRALSYTFGIIILIMEMLHTDDPWAYIIIWFISSFIARLFSGWFAGKVFA